MRKLIVLIAIAAGEIAPAEQVSVRPEINGQVDQLLVDLGGYLKRGDLLFKPRPHASARASQRQ